MHRPCCIHTSPLSFWICGDRLPHNLFMSSHHWLIHVRLFQGLRDTNDHTYSAIRVVELLDKGWDVNREGILQRPHILLPELGEGADVVAAQDVPVAVHIREVACHAQRIRVHIPQQPLMTLSL